MKRLLKALAGLLFGDYAIYHIYSSEQPAGECRSSGRRCAEVHKAEVEANEDRLLRDQCWYHGEDAIGYACYDGVRIVGLCYFWHGSRYRRDRNFWPLAEGEAKLVQIVTVPDMRGAGVAGELISFAGHDLKQRGFRRLYARIWHSNAPSLKAFERAGWGRIATVVEVHPLRMARACRMKLLAR